MTWIVVKCHIHSRISFSSQVYNAVRQTQERDAKIKMREKAKELQRFAR